MNKQNAIPFEQRIDGIARLDQFHEYLIKNKLLHGIEVVNESTFSIIALENNLTYKYRLGTSNLEDSMTLVNVESEKSVKSALFEVCLV